MHDLAAEVVASLTASRPSRAALFAERLLEASPQDLNARLLYVKALFADGQYARIASEFRNETNTELCAYVARSLVESDPNAAKLYLKSLGQAVERSAELCLVKAELLHAVQDPSCEEFFQKLKSMDATLLAGHAAFAPLHPSLASAYAEFEAGRLLACLDITRKFLVHFDSPSLTGLPLHAAALAAAGELSELFLLCHTVMKKFPARAEPWFAAGCYYFALNRLDVARKLFGKATSIDAFFAPAWLAFGHSHSLSDESEQALTVYRSCARLFPKSYMAFVCLARETFRSPAIAAQYIEKARSLSPSSIEVAAEFGVLAYANKDYSTSAETFKSLIGRTERKTWKFVLWSNLGHALLKLRDVTAAVQAFENSGDLPVGLLGLGYCRHMGGDVRGAIEAYNKCLKTKSINTQMLAKSLLSIALAEFALP